MNSLELRSLVASDLPALARCHARVFGEEGRLGEATLLWSSFGNPAGARAFVACDGERIVAAYLGRATRTWIAGAAHSFVQSVDSMVDPAYRAGLKRPGLFVSLARRYFDEYGVNGDDVVHYGWPIEEAWRIGERLLEYRLLREELVLVRELSEEPPRCPMPHEVEQQTELGEDLKWLWDRCAGAWGAATIRDAAWARWRFLEHPSQDYVLLGVRDEARVLRGLCVLRTSEWSWPGAMALCDWLVPDDEPEVASLLERGARALAAQQGAQRLIALVPDWSAAFSSFQECGWSVQLSPYRLAARSYDKRFGLAWLRKHWWMTLADSDLA